MTKILSIVFEEFICDRIHRPTITHFPNSNSRPESVAIAQFNNDHYLDFVVVNTGLNNFDIYLGQYNGTFEYHKTYSTGFDSSPYSVVIANFDNKDGIDIAVTHFGSNSIGIYLGLNDGSFISRRSISTGSSRPLFIAVNDLNNDQQLDIVVVNFGIHSIGIYLGLGDGSFRSSMIYSTGYDSFPRSLAIADLNNDHHLDIVVANSGTNNIGLFLGYGNGRFKDQKIYSTGFQSNPSSVVIDDLNNDHYLDIVVANSGRNNIKIFFGDKDGSLSREVSYSTGWNSHPSFVGIDDVNGDDQLDLIAIDSMNEKVYILPGDENGSFPFLSIYRTDVGSNPISVCGGDMNNDNQSDLLVVNRGSNNILLLMEYDMKLSNNYITFTANTLFRPVLLTTGDLNNDDVLDIVVTNDNDDLINVFIGSGNGSFSLSATISTGIGPYISVVVLGDLNNDHQLDIVVLNKKNNSFSILLGDGNGIYSTVITYSSESVLLPVSLVLGDVNEDNCLDIAIISETSDKIGIFVGYCNGTFGIDSIYRVGMDWRPFSIVMDDFNSDNHLDLAIAYSNQNWFGIYFGDGHGRFPTSQTYPLEDFSTCSAIASGDFNNDNQTDVAVALFGLNKLGIFLGYGNGTFASIRTYPLISCRTPFSMSIGDLNNDNQMDIAVCCIHSKNIVVVHGNKNGEFLSQTTYSIGDELPIFSSIFGDFNNDNLLDIAIADYLSQKVGIFISYYKAEFGIEGTYSTGSAPQPYSVATGDLNKDNVLDLIVVDSGNATIGVRLGSGDGSFQIERTYSTGQNSFPQYVKIGDLNRDGQLDVIIVNSKSDSLLIFLGNGNGTFERTLTYQLDVQSSPVGVAITDLNNDQWLDFVVVNQGTDSLGIFYGYNYTTFIFHETYSTGDGSFTLALSVSDMNNDNHLDIVVANYNSSNIGILFGYGNGSFMTQRIYLTGYNSRPAVMAVADLNKDGCSDIIIHNRGADSLNILLGDGDGNFEMTLDCAIWAGSSLSAILVGDVNNDDQLDVIVTDSIQCFVGVFLGFGNGSLSLLTTYSAGLNSTPNSIALGDLNNDSYLDIVVAHQSTGSVGVFQGYGNGSFAPQAVYFLEKGSRPYSVVLSDFNDDDQLDIAVAEFDLDNVCIFFGFGNGSFSRSRAYSIGKGCGSLYIVVGDFNYDDQADIAVICSGDSTFNILFGTKDGSFLSGKKHFTGIGFLYKAMAYGDFNNDSRPDLAIAKILVDKIDIYLGNGTEPFATPVTKLTGFNSKPRFVASGDFDHDNRSDIVVANFGTDCIGVVLANEINTNSSLMTYSTGMGSHPYALVVSDFNDDNQLDIAVMNFGVNTVTIFQGYNNGLFRTIGSYSTGLNSIPHSIAVSDFNNDKSVDIVIANAGANNVLILFGLGNGTFGNEKSYAMRYNARPYSITTGDFNNDGWIDLAVANFEAGYVEILLQTC